MVATYRVTGDESNGVLGGFWTVGSRGLGNGRVGWVKRFTFWNVADPVRVGVSGKRRARGGDPPLSRSLPRGPPPAGDPYPGDGAVNSRQLT
jgi:hypothetical protein